MPFRICVLFCCCLIFGCGSSKLYDIRAVVTLDDNPLAEAEVVLLSVLTHVPSASGITNTAGEVTFKTNEADGVLSGSYIVTVSKTVDEKRLSNDEIRALAEIGIRYKTQRIELVPEKYTRSETTDLKIKIGYWQPEEWTLNLQSKKPPLQPAEQGQR
jgi:hypothetical protein